MNTKKYASVVLCFGDSNTWGRNPIDRSRYDAQQRWTGVLQSNLGQDFYVIEEGLGGRTTDCENTLGEGRNGLLYFKPCVESHEPDAIVLMLGTNDLKDIFNKSSDDIVSALEQYCILIKNLEKKTSLILVAPTSVDVHAPGFMHPDKFSDTSVKKASELPEKIQKLAEKYGAIYINARDTAVLGVDGLHWTQESHIKFAEAMSNTIKELQL
ncbi:MAG: GDSL-type esterase/lipase family protein [Candidatus Saccharibacteria bacterium]|nr:GDSL-type esterase/lipase family protein [Candidatus Saccharibacteria bacterium]